MRFSQRIGTKPVKVDIQRESMDNDLRIGLWNVTKLSYFDRVGSKYISASEFDMFFQALWINYFKLPLDTLEDYYPDTYDKIRDWFFSWNWDEVYDFIEAISMIESPVDEHEFREACNIILERELSAYRFVGEFIVEITDQNEIREIEEAINNSCVTNLTGVNLHLQSALAMLSDRREPDYRNSIKESISAVEAIAQVISGDPKAELGKALDIIEVRVGLHPALKRGFKAIYGYTSDEGGIRHAMLEESNLGFEDAKYMLVSCSSFINYLIIKANKGGVEI